MCKKADLCEVIDAYAVGKEELDVVKDRVDALNKEIKDAMTKFNLAEALGSNVKVSLVIQNRTSVDEDKMLEILKADWLSLKGTAKLPPYIKKKEYIDMDELEKAIYKGELSNETLMKLDACKKVNEVKTLRIGKL